MSRRAASASVSPLSQGGSLILTMPAIRKIETSRSKTVMLTRSSGLRWRVVTKNEKRPPRSADGGIIWENYLKITVTRGTTRVAQ